MIKQCFWASPWLCLCLMFCFNSCSTISKTVEVEPAYRVKFAINAPSYSNELNDLLSIGHLSDIDIKQASENMQMVTMLIHGDNTLKLFKNQLSNSGLPVNALTINKE